MNVWEIILLGIALSMDAFAISICKGLSMKKMSWKYAIITGLYFGIFQALMPLIGYFLGSQFEHLIKDVDHWIAFGLLAILGIKMLIGDKKEDADKIDSSFAFKTMVVLAIATSIDALAVGITFSFLKTAIWLAIAIIGVITFVFCFVGVKIGNVFGSKYKTIAEKIGGVILILIGIKILLEHLGVF